MESKQIKMETAAVAQNYHQTPKKSLKIVIKSESPLAELTKLLAVLISLSNARRSVTTNKITMAANFLQLFFFFSIFIKQK